MLGPADSEFYNQLVDLEGHVFHVVGEGYQALGTLHQVASLDLFYIEQDRTRNIQGQFSSNQVVEIRPGHWIQTTRLK
jgi:hypothetical protein